MNRPWWRKPVVSWPRGARLLFLIATTGLAGVFLYFTWGIRSGVSVGGLGDEVAQFTNRLGLVRSTLGSLGGAGLVLVKTAGPWLPWSAAVVVGLSYITTFGLGTCCYRLVSGRE